MDFPAVTVCNLNRVNCHNAIAAMYIMKTQLEQTSNQQAKVRSILSLSLSNIECNYNYKFKFGECEHIMCLFKEKLTESILLMDQLLSENITDCIPSVCSILNTALGSSWQPGVTTQLFMFLQNGCHERLTEGRSKKI